MTATRPDLPAAVRQRIESFVRAHRLAAPRLLDTVLVTGSATAGDWWPGISDIDLVLVVARAPTSAELDRLTRVHADTIPDGAIDGLYLTASQLRSGPVATDRAVQVVDGELSVDAAGGQLSWVTWREIEQGWEGRATDEGVTAWGRSTHRFPGSDAGARAFSRDNLRAYWKPLGRDARAALEGRSPIDAVDERMLRWIALGPARLVATIETGDILSKSGAASFAADRWPHSRDLLDRAVASRRGADVTFSVSDALVALDLLDACVEAAG